MDITMGDSIKRPIDLTNNIVTLRQLAYFSAELMKLQCGWIPGTSYWELKLHLARCQWLNAVQTDGLRKRLLEFPGGKPDKAVSKNINSLMNAVAAAPHGPAFIRSLFGALKPYLVRMYEYQLRDTDPVADYPTLDIVESAIVQENKQIQEGWVQYTLWEPQLSNQEKQEAEQWENYICTLLEEMGPIYQMDKNNLKSLKSHDSFRPSSIGMRDNRFQTSFMLKAPIEDIDDPALEYEVKVVMTYFKEMQAAETVATCLYETKSMPWEFYYETSRHCWDEARHCYMGQRRMEQLGFDITTIKSMNGNYAVRQLLDPLHRYAFITMVEEAGSMRLKREWVEELEKYGKTLTARIVEYDLTDERNHVSNGFRWLPKIMEASRDSRSIEEVVQNAKTLRKQAFELLKIYVGAQN